MSTYTWNPYAFSAVGQPTKPKSVVADAGTPLSPYEVAIPPMVQVGVSLQTSPASSLATPKSNLTPYAGNQSILNAPAPKIDLGGATFDDEDVSANNSFVRTPNASSFHKGASTPMSNAMLSSTTTSIGSFTPGEEIISAPGVRRPGNYAANKVRDAISSLRSSKKDSAVPHTIRRLKKSLRSHMFAAICSDEQLVIANCKQERGNLVAPVLAVLNNDNQRAQLIAIIRRHFFDITTDRSGCVAMCRILDAADEATRLQLAELLLPHAGSLAVHIYGNYVVQHLLSECGEELCLRVVGSIIEQICHSGGIANFACSKFGSHVLEQAVNFAPSHQIAAVVQHTCAPGVVETLVNHRFGNYPLQAMLKITGAKNPQEFDRLRAAVTPYLHESQFARKLVQAMQAGGDHDISVTAPGLLSA